MRCCKDLGIASELWDPRFIREFKAKYCVEVFVEHLTTKKKRVSVITSTIKSLVELKSIDLIITTGGTGFGIRDVTPEAIGPLLQKQAPGLVHLLLSSSPKAVLSRPVAGICDQTLIITLPGSPKAVDECLEALLSGGILDHALALSRGADSRHLHENSAALTGAGVQTRHVHSHCGHHAPKPRTGGKMEMIPSMPLRARNSPFPLISLQEACQLIIKNIHHLPPITLPVNPSLRGYILAEPIYAQNDLPRYPSSNVDGYAIQASKGPGVYKVVHPGTHPRSLPVPEDSIYRINTGAPLPLGTDAVIMVEDTELVSPAPNGSGEVSSEELEVRTLAQVEVGENIRKPGSDLRKGDLIFEKGAAIGNTGGDLGALAFIGRREVVVYRKPRVAIMSTGDELADLADESDQQDEWRHWDTNRPILRGALEAQGYDVVDLGIVRDSLGAHVQALSSGLEQADIFISTGGSSMGTTDHIRPMLQEMNATVLFGRVKVKPGKPTIFAQVPCKSGEGTKPFFGLPGNPASALVTFNLFVRPALRLLGGFSIKDCQLQPVKVKLADDMPLDPRPEFHRVLVKANNEGQLEAHSTGGQRSSRASSLNSSNALVALPALVEEGPKQLLKGDMADALLIDL
ncbi:SubName: Full=Related to Gephyrin {ECO:0000313/EMBL:CCA73955.1} [Serendipita indica DSM 11827]|nr:SubName: Full=Related to Gephyrin {ECO:0000313/EMBL:CCA73955.1} [Serendipita indica DSM 11827]